MTHPGRVQNIETESPIVGIEFHLTGTYPLLQHRFGEVAEAGLDKTTKMADKVAKHRTPREWAEINCYRLSDGSIGHPSQAIIRAMCDAGVNYKLKGSRQSLRFVVPAAVRALNEWVRILDLEGKPVTQVEVDSRPVVNQKVKARVMCHRARIEHWVAAGKFSLDTELLSEEMAQQLLTDAGRRLGIGAFRPQSRGPFGVFRVTKFEQTKIDL
jgi:hypothetical protein